MSSFLWTFNVSLSVHTHTRTQEMTSVTMISPQQHPSTAESVLVPCTWPPMSHNTSLFSPDEQLWSPFIFSLTDRKWVTGRHLTSRPRWLSKGHEVAQSIKVFILFLTTSRMRSDLWPTSWTFKRLWSCPRIEEKLLKREATWKVNVPLKVLRYHRVSPLINAN